jgi:hypothetical protein
VYPETWHGEDFFYVTEPGPAVVTERVAAILEATRNLRREKVENQGLIRRLMPKYAERLEAQDWEIALCVTLGPAGWARTT